MEPNLALIGCGYWGKNLVRNFYELGALRMVCDESSACRVTASSLAPDCEIVSNTDEVFASSVDAVVIATPAVTHFALVREALECGKDVFVEKPLALTYQEGAELVRLAQANKRILMVGHVLEYHPGILQLRRLVDSGELGKVLYIYSNRVSLGKIRREENILWSFAPHDIAVILRLTGQFPIQVVACGGTYLSPN